MFARHRALAVAVALAALLVLPFAAARAADTPGSWTLKTLESVPTGALLGGPKTATNAHGDVVVAWTKPTDATHAVLRVATYTPEAGWAAPQTVGDSNGYVFEPNAAIDGAGAATVAWTRAGDKNSADLVVHVAERAPGAANWKETTFDATTPNGLTLHENAAGDALLTFVSGSYPYQGNAAIRRDGQWSAVHTFEAGLFLDGDIDTAGNAMLAWSSTAGAGGCTGVVSSQRYDAQTATWGQAGAFMSQSDTWFYVPRVAFGPGGGVEVTVDLSGCGASAPYRVYDFHQPAGSSTWQMAQYFAPQGAVPQLAPLSDGWALAYADDTGLRAAETGSYGGFSSTYSIETPAHNDFAMSRDTAGGAIAAYRTTTVRAAVHDSSATTRFHTPEPVSDDNAQNLSVAGGSAGRAALTYRIAAAPSDTIRVAQRNAGVDTPERAPVCQDVKASTGQDRSVVIPLTCTDPDGDRLTLDVPDGPQHGTLGAIDQARGVVTYTPAAGFAGTDAFTFRADDRRKRSDVAHATIDVAGAAPPQQDPGSGPPVTSGPPQADCPTRVVAQLVRLQGCFTGVNAQLDTGVGIVLRAGQVAVARGKVAMNGLLITPGSPDTYIKVYPTHIETSGDVTISAGPKVLHRGKLDMFLPDGTGKQEITPTIGRFDPTGGDFFGLLFSGSLTPTFTRDGDTEIRGPVGLRFGMKAIAEADITIVAKLDSGLQESTINVHRENLQAGPLLIKHVNVAFDPIQDMWKGSAKIELPTPNKLDVGAGLAWQHGAFKAAYGEVDNLNFQIIPGIALQRVKLLVGVDPLVLGGGLGLTGGPQISGKSAVRVDGDFSYTFSTPGRLRVDGSLKLVDVQVANAFFEYLTTGSVRFGGHVHLGLPDTTPSKLKEQPVQVDAFVDGFIDGAQFNVEAGAELVILKKGLRADLLVSSKGMAACGQLFFVSAGFGYTWETKQLTLMGPMCDVGDWRVFSDAEWGSDIDFGQTPPGGTDIPLPKGVPNPTQTASPARAVSAAAPEGVDLGSKPVVLRLRGQGGAPVVTLTGPGGRTVTVPADGSPVANDSEVVLTDEADATTYVAIHHPGGGRWTVARQPGSPLLRDIAGAPVLPSPRVSAQVTGHRRSRVLHYRASGVDGQTVTFAEIGPQTRRVIGRAHGRRGALRFVPGNGRAGTRKIVAMVARHGLPRKQMTVARYVAPPPPKVPAARNVTLRASGRALTVRWRPAAGVRRWFVTAHLTSGATRWELAPGRSGRVVVHDFATITSAKVTVVGEARDGRRGKPMTAVIRPRRQSR